MIRCPLGVWALALIALVPQTAQAAGGGTADVSVQWALGILPLVGGYVVVLLLSRRFDVPPLTIALGIGVLLGPTVLGRIPNVAFGQFLNDPAVRGANKLFSDLGVLALIFWAGSHLNLNEVKRRALIAGSVGLGGGLLIFVIGLGLAWVYLGLRPMNEDQRLSGAMLIAVLGMVAAVVTSVKVLDDVDLLKSRLGDTHFAICGVNELLAWTLLSLTFTLAQPGSGSVWSLILPPFFSILVTAMVLSARDVVGRKLLPRLLGQHPGMGEVVPTAFLVLIGLAALFSVFGTGLLYGAFLSGVLLGRWEALNGKKQSALLNFLKNVAVPVYFLTVGVQTNFVEHFSLSMAGLVLGLVAIRGIVCGVLCLLNGASAWESRSLATMQLIGGAIELAIVKLGVDRKIVNEELLTAVAIHVILSVAVVPVILRKLKGEAPQTLSELEQVTPFVGRVKLKGKKVTPQKLLSRLVERWAKAAAVRAERLTAESLTDILRGKERHGGVIGKTALRFAFANGLKHPLFAALHFPSEALWGERHQKIELLLVIIWPHPGTARLEHAIYAEIEDAVQLLDERNRGAFIASLQLSLGDSSSEFEVLAGGGTGEIRALGAGAETASNGDETNRLRREQHKEALRVLCRQRVAHHDE